MARPSLEDHIPDPIRSGKHFETYIPTTAGQHRMIGKSVYETWTQYDPELINRAVVPPEEREPLE